MSSKSVVILLLGVLCAIQLANANRYVRTPLGKVWKPCLHEIPSGSHIIESSVDGSTKVIYPDGTVFHLPKCEMPTIRYNSAERKPKVNKPRDSPDDGWQVWSAFNNINNQTFDSFVGFFNVPQSPPNWDGGILYMFTGLQNDNWVPINGEWPTPPGFDIIQPVLQYGGDSEDGGGDYWALASWYVTLDSGAVWSNVQQVNTGDVIFGNMTRIGPTTWFIGGITSSGVNSSFAVTYDRLATQAWAYCTLEVYEIDDCGNDFPPSGSTINFTQLQLFDRGGKHPVTPQWQALNNNGGHCSTNIAINSPSNVVISF